LDDRHFGQSLIRRNLEIRMHCDRHRRRGAPSAPVQPNTEPGCAGGDPAEAKKPDHRFSPSERCGFGIHGRCTFDFKTSLRLILEV
jgi:hypothetical protein